MSTTPTEVARSKFLTEPTDPLLVFHPDGRRLEYNTPEAGQITVTNLVGDVQVMTIERFRELEAQQLL